MIAQQQQLSSEKPIETDNDQKNTAAKGREIVDLCREGPNDRCMEMVAAKIMVPSFWDGAEQFVALPAPLGGHASVRISVCQHIRHLFGVSNPRWDQLLLLPDEYAAMELFARCCCSPNDVVLCPAPFADSELPVAFSLGTPNVHLLPVQLEEAPELSIADLQEAVDRLKREGRRVRAVLLHNPHPILSWVGDGKRRLAHILEWAAEREIFLMVDESLAAMDLWEFSSCLELDHRSAADWGQWLVWIWSAGKHFSLPGLAFAALLLPRPDLLCPAGLPFLRLHPCAPLVQFLTTKLLIDFEWTSELFARRKSRLEELRRNTIEGLAGMGLMRTLVAPEEPTSWILADLKTFLTDLNFESERALRKEFAESASLRLNSGEQLGMADPGWFRIRVASSGDKVDDLLSRLKMVMAGRKGSVLEWERMDMSKYGGTPKKRMPWGEETRKKRMVKKEGEEERRRRIRSDDNEEMVQWDEWEGEEERDELTKWKKLTKKKMEEGEEKREEMEVMSEDQRRVLPLSEGIKEKKCREDGEDDDDDRIMREVFAIFPMERFCCKEPFEREEMRSLKEWEEHNRMMTKQNDGRTEVGKGQNEEIGWMKKTKDVRDELDIREKDGEKKREEMKPKTEMLTDLSFIEELVKSQEVEKEQGTVEEVAEGEYYDEASTEEEEKRMDESEKEEEEEESRRIIQIIDQIFHEAVQIREYSEEHNNNASEGKSKLSNKYNPTVHNTNINNINRQHYPQQQPRSESALTSESPPEFISVSPIIGAPDQPHQHLFSISERSDLDQHFESQFGFIRSETVRSRDSAFISDSSPIQTSKLAERSKWMLGEEEWEDGGHRERRGMTAQMLDDSGIFVDLPPGSLSIDFPLLVPTEWMRLKIVDIADQQQLEDEVDKGILKLDLHFKTDRKETFSEEELYGMVARRAEEDEERIGTMVVIPDNEEPDLGWRPMEDVEPEEEAGQEMEEHIERELNEEEEGSAYCPDTVGRGREVSRVEVNGEEEMGQREETEEEMRWRREEEERRQREETEEEMRWRREEEEMGQREETEEEMRWRREEEEMGQREETEEEMRWRREEEERGREEAADVVAQWNARLVKEERIKPKKRVEGEAKEKVEMDMHLVDVGRAKRGEEWTEVRWEGEDKDGRTVIRLEEKISLKSGEEKEGGRDDEGEENRMREEGRTRIEVNVEEEGKWRRPELNIQRWRDHLDDNDNDEEEDDDQLNIPGRSRYFQVHQRMQMGRRLGENGGISKSRSRDAMIELEHMNITKLEYIGKEMWGGMRTNITTKINRWAEDEWFRKIPTEEWMKMEEKIMEERKKRGKWQRRSNSVPSIDGGWRRREDGREEEEMEVKRKEEGSEEEVSCRVVVRTEEEEWNRRERRRRWPKRRSTHAMNENAYKRMKREREGRAAVRGEQPAAELHSEFETTHYEMSDGAKSIGRTWHEYRKPNTKYGNRTPSRIVVTTSGGREGPDSVDRVTVRHTPGSRWIVSSVYRSTEWGWEKTTLR